MGTCGVFFPLKSIANINRTLSRFAERASRLSTDKGYTSYSVAYFIDPGWQVGLITHAD